MSWETVIGLEIHTQLATRSKIFSAASTAYGAVPNTQACAVDLGLPGVLPVLNTEAVNMAIKFGLAVDAEVAQRSVFARKNYFYPDLPKGYQISQFELPIVGKGHLTIELEDGTTKEIGITRAHLEEDAGKSMHGEYHGMTGIDLNRAGTPLLEIVSEPDMRSAKEAVAYMKKIHSLVRYIGISDGNMQEGSFRCDVNVSVRKQGEEKFGTRTEIKNLNSFRFVEEAIEKEVEWQIEALENNEEIKQQTRLYNPDKQKTVFMRFKEDSDEYRYFPDPDLLPVVITTEDIERIKASLPELPDAKKQRYMSEMGLSAYDAGILTADRDTAEYFENVLAKANEPKQAANWIIVNLTSYLNKEEKTITESPVSAEMLAGMLLRLADKTLNSKTAKQVFEAMWQGEGDADTIIDKKGIKPADAGEVEKIIDEIIANNPSQVEQFKSGKEKVFGFFVGQAMKATKGNADPAQINQLLRDKLK